MSAFLEFLAPGFLAGLAAVAVPLVIHLIHRRRTRVIPFSTLRFLALLERQVARRRRIQDWLILFFRMGVLAFLALALAAPVVRSAAGRLPVARVVLVDDSYSMRAGGPGGGDRFGRARKVAEALLARLRPGDRGAVAASGTARARLELTADLPALRPKALALRPSFGAHGLAPAVERALAALRRTTLPRRELVLVTDLQARALRPVLTAGLLPARDVETVVVDVGRREWTNLGLTEAALLPLPGPAPGTHRLLVGVTNWGRRPEATGVRVQAGGRTLARRRLTVGPGATEAAVLEVAGASGGGRSLTVTLGRDDLPADDTRIVVLPPPEPPRVLVARAAPSAVARLDPAFYLLRALRPEEDLAAATPTVCRTTEIPRFDLDRFALVILADGAPLPAEAATALREYVERGGRVLLGADPAGALGALEAFPAGGVRARGFTRREGDGPVLRLVPAAPAHPVLRSLRLTSPPVALGRVHVFRHAGLEVEGEEARVVLRFSDGAPALVDAPCGAGRLLVLATTFTPAWTDLPLRVSFVPLTHALVRHLARLQRLPTGWPVLTPLTVRYAPGGSVPKLLRIAGPDGRREVQPERRRGGMAAVLGSFRRPGLYRVTAVTPAGTEEAWVAVHVEPGEGDLTRLDPGNLPVPVVRPEPGRPLPARLLAHPPGLPLAGWLLALALACFLLEGWLAGRRTVEGLLP